MADNGMQRAVIGENVIRSWTCGFVFLFVGIIVSLLGSPLVAAFAPPGVSAERQGGVSAPDQAGDEVGWITGRVTDAVTDLPVARARVEVGKRLLDTLPGGSHRLRPLDQTLPLGIVVQTNQNGGFRVRVPLSHEPNFFNVRVRAEGYEELWNAFVQVRADQVLGSDFQLIKDHLTPREVEILGRKRERQKLLLYLQNPAFDQALDAKRWFKPGLLSPLTSKDASPLLTQGIYSVPDEVYVVELAGFTGWINLDEYIAGVVSIEMGDGFPLEALKAQAVAARSFALERFNRTGVANGGQAFTPMLGGKSRTATINSSKIVMLHEGRVIAAFFSARCNGDFTLNSEDGLSGFRTCVVGGLGVGQVAYARSRPCSGHINCSETIEPCCNVFVEDRWQYLFGHGVGLCQRGAQEFAGRDGFDWQEILTGYYTDIALVNLPGLTTGDVVMTTTTLNVRDDPCGNRLATVPQAMLGTIVGGPERPPCELAEPYSFFTWWNVLYSDGTSGWSVEDYLRKETASTFFTR